MKSVPASQVGDELAAVRIPRVTLIVELENHPQLVMDCATPEDRLALIAWIAECRPDIDRFLRGISREIHEKKRAAKQ